VALNSANMFLLRSVPRDLFHPPTQEAAALAVEECVTLDRNRLNDGSALLRRICAMADDPPKPWRLHSEVPAFCEADTCRQASAPRGEGGYVPWGPRLRAETPTYRRQALRRADTGLLAGLHCWS
jgi:hypothetical protein